MKQQKAGGLLSSTSVFVCSSPFSLLINFVFVLFSFHFFFLAFVFSRSHSIMLLLSFFSFAVCCG